MVKSANAAAGDQPSPLGLEKIVESIGPKIRELRLQQKLSLQQLAVRAEVSAAAIHKVERNDMVPTITTLLKVASALGRPIGYFIDDDASQQQVAVHSRAKDRQALPGGPEGTESFLFSGPGNRFQLHGTIEVIEPGAGGSAEPARAPAGEEIAFILDGGLEFDVGDERYTLGKTDSLHYRTEHPRRWTNHGRKAARVLWVVLGSV
jgi:transcriptional regulator with XRE-family HTH domain